MTEHTTGPRVLVVDDDPDVRDVVTRILKTQGFEVTPSATGTDALQSVAVDPPAVALIDLLLEDIPGLVVMNRIKKASPCTECIVVTGHASQESAIASVNLGAFNYVEKPVDKDDLIVTVKAAMGKWYAEKALRQSEARYRTLAETVEDFICLVDPAMVIQYVNTATARNLGKTPEDLIGKAIGETMSPQNAKWMVRHTQEAFLTGNHVTAEEEMLLPSGKTHVSVRCVPVCDERGIVTSVHWILRTSGSQKA